MKSFMTIMLMLAFAISIPAYGQEKADSAMKHSMETKPAVKEVEAFHEYLHPLVHDAYPNKDFATIRKATSELLKLGKAMKSAKLPKELSAKKKEYDKSAKKLVDQLSEMDKKKNKLSDEEFGKKFMEMHHTFEEIMGIVS